MERHLLIVDDDEDVRNVLSRHFRFNGFEVDLAENGCEALDVLSREAIRVVISDVTMPEMDGIELLRKIRDLYPMTRVIMITGYVALDYALACARNHAETCIFKPIDDTTELDVAVADAFGRLEHWERKFLELQDMKRTGVVS